MLTIEEAKAAAKAAGRWPKGIGDRWMSDRSNSDLLSHLPTRDECLEFG